MNIDRLRERMCEYYTAKLDAFGASAKGVDYNGIEAQERRFEQLVKVICTDASIPPGPFAIIDYGSGYGAMLDFLLRKAGWQFQYFGVDLIERMVVAGREMHPDVLQARFTTDEREVPKADYLVAGGIFNVKCDAPLEDWQEVVCDTLHRMDALCSKGFSFNMLTKYSDADRMAERPELYYGDPLFFFDFCKRSFSRNVALLHDYDLYDFTILVRKDV